MQTFLALKFVGHKGIPCTQHKMYLPKSTTDAEFLDNDCGLHFPVDNAGDFLSHHSKYSDIETICFCFQFSFESLWSMIEILEWWVQAQAHIRYQFPAKRISFMFYLDANYYFTEICLFCFFYIETKCSSGLRTNPIPALSGENCFRHMVDSRLSRI